MKNKNRDCITDMQWSSKHCRRNGFKVIHARPDQLKRRREISGTYYVQKKIQDPFYMNNSPGLVKACGELNWNHELETHGIPERTVRRVKEGTSSLVRSDWTLRKLVGQQQWSSITISEMCKTYQQMARRPMNDGSIHHSAGRLFHLKQK